MSHAGHGHDAGEHGRAHGHGDGDGAHSHGLTRSGETAGVSDARLVWAVLLNQLLTVFQVIGGVLSGSLSLLSDAAHNFSDANALLIAYVARRIARRRANERYTFGYRRAELIGAMINLTTLIVVGLYLVYEAVLRFFVPEPIVAGLMAAVAVVALVVDLGSAALLWSLRAGSLNMRAAFVHNITDALGSLAVLIGAGLVAWRGWLWIDPLLTLLIAGYVLWQAGTLLPQAARMLMEGAPPGIDSRALTRAVCAVPGVEGLHHLHLWELDESHVALEAHLVIHDAMAAPEREALRARVKQLLRADFGIGHCTLELEAAEAGQCEHDARCAGAPEGV